MNSKKEELNHITSKNQILNIKNNFIANKVIKLLNTKKLLEIVKYNKKLQQKFNIDINSYKEYLEIEIEIIPAEKKYDNENFIIIKEEDRAYYHIYFDNNKEEIKSTNINKDDKISKIKIIIDHQIKSFNYLFYFCEYIKSINFKKFNRINITDMSHMFAWCTSLEEINLSNFKTDNVNDMSYMFDGCSSLKKLNLSNFNTKNVNNMNHMFSGCSSLQELNLSNFNTNKVIDMNHMFSQCILLNKLNLSNFDTNNVKDMNYMFSFCYALSNLDISNFKKNNDTSFDCMFNGLSGEFINKIKAQLKISEGKESNH